MVVRVTPVREAEAAGTIALAAPLPRPDRYAVWLRVRQFAKGKTGALALTQGGEALGVVKVSSPDWAWVKVATARLDPAKALTLSSADTGVAVDRAILTDATDYTPDTADDRKAAPAAVTGLKVAKAGANAVELTWNASGDPDLYCYNVYVGDSADFAPGNETLLCSTRKAAAADWGIPAGRKYVYKVVAIDKQGGRSAPATLSAETTALKTFVKALAATDASATDGIAKADAFVEYAGAKSGKQSLAFEFEVPTDGQYYVWMKSTPTFNSRYAYDSIGLAVDDDKAAQFRTRPRATRGKLDRWFCERIFTGREFKGGKHKLTLQFGKDGAYNTTMGQRVATIWVTNDASFVPPGYTAQVMFKSAAKWRGL